MESAAGQGDAGNAAPGVLSLLDWLATWKRAHQCTAPALHGYEFQHPSQQSYPKHG